MLVDATFYLVFCVNAIPHFKQLDQLNAEARRLLRPGQLSPSSEWIRIMDATTGAFTIISRRPKQRTWRAICRPVRSLTRCLVPDSIEWSAAWLAA